jgi:hypothetical protein
MNVKEGSSRGSTQREGKKEYCAEKRMENMLHVYIQRHHKEIHQTLFSKGGRK